GFVVSGARLVRWSVVSYVTPPISHHLEEFGQPRRTLVRPAAGFAFGIPEDAVGNEPRVIPSLKLPYLATAHRDRLRAAFRTSLPAGHPIRSYAGRTLRL